MMKVLLLIFGLQLAHAINAQETDDDNVFVKVEMGAAPNAAKWKAHLLKHSVLPDSIRNAIPEGEYKAVVEFVVDVHGNLGQFTIKSDPGYGLGKRLVQILRKYNDPWQPASQCGRNVRSYKTETLIFRIGNE